MPKIVNARLVLNITLGVAMLACIVGAAVLVLRDSRSPDGVVVNLPSPTPAPAESRPASQVSQIMVYVSGEVIRPGVYTLNSEHRVADALNAAGGPTADADLDRINLAMRLNDEDQVHVPSAGSNGVDAVQPTGAPDSTSSGKLNVNTATVKELESLPGIGSAKAAAIVEYRNMNGPFERVEDLVEVRGIGDGILGSILHLLEVR